jgi:hypothetical protein
MWLFGASLGFELAIFVMRVLEVMFFVGLAGCAGVVIFSWISIFGSGFTKDTPTDT